MKINMQIPGWNGPDVLRKLATYAANVPENGNILELGAFFGRTTFVLGHNKRPSVKLTSIDWWITFHYRDFVTATLHDGLCGEASLNLLTSKTSLNPDRINGDDFMDLWKMFTAGIPNNEYIRGRTDIPTDQFPKFDFIYHDAGHSYKEVYADLNHWFPKLMDNGIFVLDDYDRGEFSGLCDAVDQFVSENNLISEMITNRNILLKRK